MLKFFNTITKQKEEFIPQDRENIRMYVCGPTVYDDIHIGNARPIVVFDSIFKLLQQKYKKVTYVRNITDIDDKIIIRAKENNESINDLTTRTTVDFHNEIKKLNVLEPTFEPKATDNIKEMQNIIQQLIARGYAYVVEGNVFFAVDSYLDYGKLSSLSRDEIIAGSRVEINNLKRNAADFVLWKPSKDGEIGYSSPWDINSKGGRPGWHIECSAMAKRYLGDNFDIHGGGKDLTFPHHENERAQSICASCGEIEEQKNNFVNYWLHNGFVMVEGKKMSKSLGNFLTLKEVNKQYDGEVIRLTLLNTHYRQPLDFKADSLEQNQNVLIKFYKVLQKYEDVKIDDSVNQEIEQTLGDDFNAPKAISILHRLFSLLDENKSIDDCIRIKSEILNCGYILGILQSRATQWLAKFEVKRDIKLSHLEIENLIKQREQAKLEKNYQRADEIREYLKSCNVILEDSKNGTTWRLS